MPQDVGRPEVTVLQQARQRAGTTDRRVQGAQLILAQACCQLLQRRGGNLVQHDRAGAG